MNHELRDKPGKKAEVRSSDGELSGLQTQLPKIKIFPKVKAFSKSIESSAFSEPSLKWFIQIGKVGTAQVSVIMQF